MLSTPWGAQSDWSQHPLLVALHREAWGGEKFFEMLDRVSQDPARYIDLMELQYLVPRVRFRRQVSGARSRPRAARRDPAGSLSQDPQPSQRAADGALAALARPRRSAQSAHPLRALVGGRRRGAGDPHHRVHHLLREPRELAAPVHAALAKIGVEVFDQPVAARQRARRSSNCWRRTKREAR